MRRMLAGFLATSMIVAVASSVSFAATKGQVEADVGDLKITPTVQVTPDATLTSGEKLNVRATINSVTFTFGSGDEFTLPVGASTAYEEFSVSSGTSDVVCTAAQLISDADLSSLLHARLDGTTFDDLRCDGNIYSGSVKVDAGNKKIILTVNGAKFAPSGVTAKLNLSYDAKNNVTGNEVKDGSTSPAIVAVKRTTATVDGTDSGITGASATPATGGTDYADVESSGSLKDLRADAVLVCDGNGNPIPYTESKSSVDEAQNDEDGIQSGATLYFQLRDDGIIPKLDDDTYWKLKVTKGDNAKYIKSIDDVSKTFSDGLYPLNGSSKDPKTAGRHRYIKVALNDIYTDDEYKITLDMRISAKTKAVDAKLKVGSNPVTDDDEIKIKDFYFYMKNLVKAADNDWEVGIGGLMLNPIENDWNEVTYYDEDGDVAFMKFFADSDTSKFFAKLSTKWEHADYASYFNDQDAYIFDFTGSPKLSSTSRADLEIYNPFIDEDGDETIDPATATIYQVIDGDLFDVTDNFTYEEGNNGDMAFKTRTRFLGTYIICEKPVEEAADTEAPDTDLVPEEAPSEVTPDGGSNDGGKAPANTGKYL